MMAALSMATIARLVNGPGLGKPVVSALQALNVGAASVAGLAIVVMAIMLDRTTTAASERSTGKSDVGFGQRHERDAHRGRARTTAALGRPRTPAGASGCRG